MVRSLMAIADRMTVVLPGADPPQNGPWNMAADEWLLRTDRYHGPILRLYGWSCASVTFGYFQSHREIQVSFPTGVATRRWTGGGAVLHGDPAELTYSLALPREHALAQCRPRESYRAIHRAVGEALRLAKVEVRLIESDSPDRHLSCFQRPVEGDLILPSGEKAAGAAQKRTRFGVLVQGSIRLPRDIPAQLPDHLAGRFAQHPELVGAEEALDADAIQSLADERYGLREWTERVP